MISGLDVLLQLILILISCKKMISPVYAASDLGLDIFGMPNIGQPNGRCDEFDYAARWKMIFALKRHYTL